MNLDIDAPRGWVRDYSEDYPAFRAAVPRSDGDGVLCGYLRVVIRSTICVDVIVDDREKAKLTDDWTPRQGGEIDILVHHEEAQEWVDIAAAAWLTWAQNAWLCYTIYPLE